MAGQTVILEGPRSRALARSLIERAPDLAVVNIREATRSGEQNAKLWAMLSDVSRAKPGGRMHTPDVWKALFMNAAGYEVAFETGLSGEPFPIGFRSSRLNKRQMSELIEFILAWGSEQGVAWSDEAKAA